MSQAKSIKDLVHSTLQPQSEPASTRPEGSQEAQQTIKELFLLMKATWGNKYTSQFKSPEDVKLSMRVWLRSFHSTDKNILHHALERLGRQLEWPPTVEQMLKEVRVVHQERTVFLRSLPAPAKKRTKEIGLRTLSQIRSRLHRNDS